MSTLERWGRGTQPTPYLLQQVNDGYWTPWHIAQEALRVAEARYEYIRNRWLSDDVEAPFLPDDATHAETPEAFDAAIDAAIAQAEYEAGRQAAQEPYEDPSAIFGDPRA